MTSTAHKILIAYCATVTAAAAVLVLGGASRAPTQSFDQISVHRINVVEPDGTLRMVISDKAKLPGVIVKGREQPRADRPQAGMLFYNDEGTENGGLIFGGRKNERGEIVDAGGSLSFDKYGSHEVVQLAGVDDKTDHFAGLAVGDNLRRLWMGRTDDGDASVALMDASGHKRIVMKVTAAGEARIDFLDASGRVVRELLPNS